MNRDSVKFISNSSQDTLVVQVINNIFMITYVHICNANYINGNGSRECQINIVLSVFLGI